MAHFNGANGSNLSRRDVLKRAGAAGITVAGLPTVVSAGELTDAELLEILNDPKVQSIVDEIGTFVVESAEGTTREMEIDGTTYTFTESKIRTDLGVLGHNDLNGTTIAPTVELDIENNPGLEDLLPNNLQDRPDEPTVFVRGLDGDVLFGRTITEAEWAQLEEDLGTEMIMAPFYYSHFDGYQVGVDEGSDADPDPQLYNVSYSVPAEARPAISTPSIPDQKDVECAISFMYCGLCVAGGCDCPVCLTWMMMPRRWAFDTWYHMTLLGSVSLPVSIAPSGVGMRSIVSRKYRHPSPSRPPCRLIPLPASRGRRHHSMERSSIWTVLTTLTCIFTIATPGRRKIGGKFRPTRSPHLDRTPIR